MRLILLGVLLLTSTALQAQRFSTGLRTGIGLWKGAAYNSLNPESTGDRTTTWEKEVFIRYEAKKHFAYEVGLQRTNGEQHGAAYGACYTGMPQPSGYVPTTEIKEQYYALNLRVQYGINCMHIKGLTNYPGIVVAPTLQVLNTSDVLYSAGTQDYISLSNTEKTMVFQFGFEDMVRYQLSRHIDIHTIISCRANPQGYQLKHAFTAEAGVAYRF